jgi:ERCC4-related helicase
MAEWKLKGIEERSYQLALANQVATHADENYIVTADTGMGKTIIGYQAIVLAHNTGRLGDGKALIVPRTRVMLEHWYNFSQKLGLGEFTPVYVNRRLEHLVQDLPWDKKQAAYRSLDAAKRENYAKSGIVISTPKILSRDIRTKRFPPEQFEKTKLILFDEIHNLLVPDPHEPITNFRLNRLYEELFGQISGKQLVGMTATMRDRWEARALEYFMHAKIIAPSPEDTQKYAPKLEVRKFYIVDPTGWINNMDTLLRDTVVSQMRRIKKKMRRDDFEIFTENGLWTYVKECMNSGDPDLAMAARSLTKAIYTRLLLYEGTFPSLYRYVKGQVRQREEPMTEEEQQALRWSTWYRLGELVEQRAKENPVLPKTESFVKLVERSVKNGEKVLVFDRFIGGCKELQRVLEHKNIPSGMVSGKMSGQEQAAVFSGFEKGDYSVLISTTGVGGEGVDLPSADSVIQYGFSSSPTYMAQRAGRIRGGIERYLVYASTAEDAKYRRLQESLLLLQKRLKRIKGSHKLTNEIRSMLH